MPDKWLSEFLSDNDDVHELSDVQRLLGRAAEVYGLKTIAYLGTGLSTDRHVEPYIVTNYSSDWIQRYKVQRYVEIDPVIQIGLRRLLPIDWQHLNDSSDTVRNFFGEATEFGVGRQGLSIPVHGQHGDRALFSITSDLSDKGWHSERGIYMRDFQVLALHIHAMLLRVEGAPATYPALSPRERECLCWIAEGKTAWECALILGLSVHTVRCYLESARYKLRASSNTHAVSKAIKAGLLSIIP